MGNEWNDFYSKTSMMDRCGGDGSKQHQIVPIGRQDKIKSLETQISELQKQVELLQSNSQMVEKTKSPIQEILKWANHSIQNTKSPAFQKQKQK